MVCAFWKVMRSVVGCEIGVMESPQRDVLERDEV